jgi:hypothetical protein
MPKLSKADQRGKITSTQARLRKDVALAGLRELQLAKARGEVVPVAEVEENWTTIARQTRDAIMALPTRVIGHCPVEWRGQLSAVLDRETRALLTTLSDTVRAGSDTSSGKSSTSGKSTGVKRRPKPKPKPAKRPAA